MFLIDTNVISEARKGRRADTGVQGFWAAAARGNTPLFLAAITIGELPPLPTKLSPLLIESLGA